MYLRGASDCEQEEEAGSPVPHTQRMKVAVWGLRALHSPRKVAGVAARSLHGGTQTTCYRAYSHT